VCEALQTPHTIVDLFSCKSTEFICPTVRKCLLGTQSTSTRTVICHVDT